MSARQSLRRFVQCLVAIALVSGWLASAREQGLGTDDQAPGSDGLTRTTGDASGALDVRRTASAPVMAGDQIPDLVISPGTGGVPTRIVDGVDLSELGAGFPFGAGFGAGVRTAVGELSGDAVADLAVAMGPGGGLVRVYNGATMAQLGSGAPFGGSFAGGVSLALGDLDGDGRPDIVTGQASGGGGVRAFSSVTFAPIFSLTPFGPGYAGGVNLAAADVDGDGRAEVIVAQASGGTVAVVSGATHTVTASGAPYGAIAGGVFVAAADVNGDGRADVVIAPGSGSGPVLVFDVRTLSLITSFAPYGAAAPGGVRVAATDLTGDGHADIITVPGPGVSADLKIFDGATFSLLATHRAYPPGYTGGAFVSAPPAQADPPPHPGAPGAPALDAASLGQNLRVEWSAPTTGGTPTGYRVLVGTRPGGSDFATVAVGDTTSLTTPAPPIVLYVRVIAINAWGPGPPSNEVVVVPAPPMGSGQFSATITWDTVADLDLHVNEPTGDHVFHGTAATRRGPTALLDVEDSNGFGPENIYTDRPAANGTYDVYVVPYAGAPERWPATARITVRVNAGTPAEQHRVFTRTFIAPDPALGQNVATVAFPGGLITESTGTRPVSYDTGAVVVNPWAPRRLGERTLMTASAYEGGARVTTTFTWTSSDPSVIDISADGHAIARAAGTAVVTARAAASAATGTVTVSADNTAVIPRPTSGNMLTLWPPRGGEQPALVQGGHLKVINDVFCAGAAFSSANPRLVPCLAGYRAVNDPDTQQTPWNLGSVGKLDWEGNLIGVLTDVGADGGGTLRVLDRFEEWTVVGSTTGDILDFSLETVGSRTAYPRTYRVGVVHTDGRVRVKNGLQTTTWTDLAGVNNRRPRLVLDGNRIGLVYADGEVLVQDGIGTTWSTLLAAGTTAPVADLLLEGNRVGLRFEDGRVWVKDSIAPAAPWSHLVEPGGGGGAAQLVLEGNRIAVRHTDGRVQAKDGITGTWWRQDTGCASGGAADVVLQSVRIGLLCTNGQVVARDTLQDSAGGWHLLKSGVVKLVLQQGYVGVITRAPDGNLHLQAKMGLDGRWTAAQALGTVPVSQLRLIVDVPAKPWRVGPQLDADRGWGNTDPSNNLMNHGRQRELCRGDVDCYVNRVVGIPVGYYGWFCGANSVNEGGYLDPVDIICRHHDYWQSMYSVWGIESLGVFGHCIVVAGADKARLTTSTGTRVPYNLADWPSVERAFDSMPATGDALRYYWNFPNCSDGALSGFLDSTTSKR